MQGIMLTTVCQAKFLAKPIDVLVATRGQAPSHPPPSLHSPSGPEEHQMGTTPSRNRRM